MKRKSLLIWGAWLVMAVAIAGYLGAQIFVEEQKPDFLIGETSHGHFQIELQCTACHESAFGGDDVLQNACVSCHAEELKEAHDSHPKSKFTDPRNADRLEKIDARQCIACHVEHNPEITHPMGVSLPQDFCFHCHADIAEERPSHEGMEFETCASSGCHNYHDNRALYEDFLVEHAHQPPLKDNYGLRSYGLRSRDFKNYVATLGLAKDEPPVVKDNLSVEDTAAYALWVTSKHHDGNVGCASCHGTEEEWQEQPPIEQCQTCHQLEYEGFISGKHGMRLAQGLTPMTPAMSRAQHGLAFSNDSLQQPLTCNTCHNPHSVDVQDAAVSGCLNCHEDDHSQAFLSSPHGQLWQSFEAGEIPENEAVSCASCHMPRIEESHHGIDRILVQHNQNTVLRPNEKMIRPVCMSCHGLAFSIDALADETLIKNNFSGLPEKHIESIDMSLKRAH